jgi:drug/metabolite transporter (DMT)-like permease
MTLKILVLVLIAEICGASTHTFFKHGVNDIDVDNIHTLKDYLRFIKQVLAKPQIWLGLLVVSCGMGVWLLVLAHAELSMAFPLDSIQYIIILFSSYLFLGERINRDRIIGTAFIIGGIVLVALK